MRSHRFGICIPLRLESHMPYTVKQFVACRTAQRQRSWAARRARPKRAPPMTVDDLMEDRVMLDGVLLKCNQNPAEARNELGLPVMPGSRSNGWHKDVDPTEEAKRNAEFERSREKLRLAQEKLRQEQEEKTKFDAYSLPVVPVSPVDSAPGGGAAASGNGSPGLAQTKP